MRSRELSYLRSAGRIDCVSQSFQETQSRAALAYDLEKSLSTQTTQVHGQVGCSQRHCARQANISTATKTWTLRCISVPSAHSHRKARLHVTRPQHSSLVNPLPKRAGEFVYVVCATVGKLSLALHRFHLP